MKKNLGLICRTGISITGRGFPELQGIRHTRLQHQCSAPPGTNDRSEDPLPVRVRV